MANYDQLKGLGFQDLEGDDYGISYFDDGDVLVVARRDKGDKYRIGRVRDNKRIFYGGKGDEMGILDESESLGELLSVLRNPARWSGIDKEMRSILFKIAESPRGRNIESLIDETFERVKECKVGRDNLEIEFDSAVTAYIVGDSNRFVEGGGAIGNS